MKMQISADGIKYFVGYYMGPNNTSQFAFKYCSSIASAMLFVKSKLEYFKSSSYGFSVYSNEQVKKGRHYVPKTFLEWHRDGEDCRGELVNPEVGWRIFIDENNQVREEHFTPMEE